MSGCLLTGTLCPVGKGDAGVSFELELPAGETYLNGYFVRSDGSKIGSYHADIEKL